MAVLGIATGVLALIVIIAVMNGFQLSFIEAILEISSYHLRLESVPAEKISQVRESLISQTGITAAVPFVEFQALARGKRTGQQAVVVRGLPENTLALDKAMEGKMDFIKEGGGFFDISDNSSVVMGNVLAGRLGLGLGDKVTVFSITGIFSAEEEDSGMETFTVTGIFKTGYYEYDSSLAFVNLQSALNFTDINDIIIGVKINDRFKDKFFMEQVKKKLSILPEYEEIVFSSWRDYNRSFFGALRTEKLFMFILVGLIFIVVGLNIFQSQRRSVLQRREDIGLLRATGGAKRAVRFVFVFDGAVIGFTGAAAGLVFGLLIASRIEGFFKIIEIIVNSIISFINIIAGFFGAGLNGNFTVFSPGVFYISEIPSRILTQEVVIIFLFGFLSALSAAWFASRKISGIQPAEVLRYE
jgi:lipoprotein-releasing system permease protein